MKRVKLLDGYTLTHEHMTIGLTPGDLGTISFDLLSKDLKMAYDCGVRNIVDLTNQSMGRDPAYVKRLMDETGINIVMSTGYYLERYISSTVAKMSVNELTELAIDDLTRGIGNTELCAGVIGEIAWSKEGPCEMEQIVWQAMSAAAVMTDAVVSTHPSWGGQQIPQAEYLISRGIKPEKIVIGHVEFFPDDDSLKELLKKGVYIGLDMIGKNGSERDEYRADVVRQVRDWGCLSQLLLSLDLCCTGDLRASGSFGYVHLFENFIPMLKDRGITQNEIDLMLKDNPARLFA
jgi:phosphotriesterase-related protein